MRGAESDLLPLAKAEKSMAAWAQKGLGSRAEAGSERKIRSAQLRGQGAEHRADLNVGSVGTRRGRRGHRGMGQ